MTVSLYWQPIKGKYLNANGNSTTREALARAFGSFPLGLDDGAIPKLEGLSAGDPNNKAYEELISAIYKHKRIQVSEEY